jgi:hypothetical protein
MWGRHYLGLAMHLPWRFFMAVATPSPLQRYRAERNDLGA